jgi:hypothetical protein
MDNIICKKKYKKSYNILNEILPNDIVQKYPIKSLMRCFAKLDINHIINMNTNDIISIYKTWRYKEAKKRRELRTPKNKIETIDDNFINKYLSIDEKNLIDYYKNNKFESIDKNIDINKIFN